MRWDTSKVNIGMMIMAMVLVDCYIDDDGKRRRCGGIPAALWWFWIWWCRWERTCAWYMRHTSISGKPNGGAHFWNQITMCCPLSLFQEGQERCKTGIVDDYFDWIKMVIGTFFLVPGWGCWGEKTKTPSRGETSRPHFYKVGNAIITKVSWHYHHWDFHLSQAIKELRTCWTEAIVPQLEVSFFFALGSFFFFHI